MKGYCDVCNRVASVRLKVMENGRPRSCELCSEHYQEYQMGFSSPFGSLRRGLFDNFLNDFANAGSSLRDRESIDIDEYLSEEAKEIMQKAAQKALEQGTQTIDTEHFLYSLIDTTVVENILKRFKLSSDDLKQHIEVNHFERNKKDELKTTEVEVSPRVKSALYTAFSISRDMGHSYIGPEHIFIALMEIGEGAAYEILKTYGLSPESLRQKTIKVVGKGPKHEGKEQSETPSLDKYSRDLTRMAIDGKLDPVIGRSKEISTTIEILARRTKNNPVLIGEPGVGKTAIVEGLAQRIANEEVPEVLRDKRLVELNINAVVAGLTHSN